MTTQERYLLTDYKRAQTIYDRAPSYSAAQVVALIASQLAAISDDWQHLANEAHYLISAELDRRK